MQQTGPELNQGLILQFAQGTEATILANKLDDILTEYETEKRKVHERFTLETHTINDRFLGKAIQAHREYVNRTALLEQYPEYAEDAED